MAKHRYSHVFALRFSIESDFEEPVDVTTAMIMEAVLLRLVTLSENDELIEGVGTPEETTDHGED